MRLALILALFASPLSAQTVLQQKIASIAADAHGKVAVACSLPGSDLNCDLNPRARPPMQSVFKLPLALTALHLIEQGNFSLDQPIRFLPDDRILPQTYSPLQDRYPDANVDAPLRELLRLAASLSDNPAADTVLRVIGGPEVVQNYVALLGIAGFHLEDGEHGLHQEVQIQYRNWFEPLSAVRLLRRIQRQFSAQQRAHCAFAGLAAGFADRNQAYSRSVAGANCGDAQDWDFGVRKRSRVRNQ